MKDLKSWKTGADCLSNEYCAVRHGDSKLAYSVDFTDSTAVAIRRVRIRDAAREVQT